MLQQTSMHNRKTFACIHFVIATLAGPFFANARASDSLLNDWQSAYGVDAVRAAYSPEWKFNVHGPKDSPPAVGLALSGGGMRSGTFAIGVLDGLREIGILSQVDAISSVSGGGYAASWYYIQNTANVDAQGHAIPANGPELFSVNQLHQCYLENHGELIGNAPAQLVYLRRFRYFAIDCPLLLASQPVNGFANGLFGWHANVSPMRYLYQRGLDRTFHVVPKDCDLTILPEYKHVEDLSFPELGHRIEGRLPFPIVNTTAHIQGSDLRLKDRVFEFTPLRFGSDYYGYWTDRFPFQFDKAIEVSGAAVDTKKIKSSAWRLAASALNTDLGYYIDNPRVSGGGRWARKALPLPFYLMTGGYQRDKEGDRIYLADGGHSENLGAFSLIRRLCKCVIIVDAAYDPEPGQTFEEYHLLKRALHDELDLELNVPGIPDPNIPGTGPFNPSQPIMIGKVVPNKASGATPMMVIYIKLSIDHPRLEADGYAAEITRYYTSTIGNTQFGETSRFPQESTLDQSYYPQQVRAYHLLGRTMVHDAARIWRHAGLIP